MSDMSDYDPMLHPVNELERVAIAISSVMPCRLCPSPCKARENSSMANCVSRWTTIMTNAVMHGGAEDE